jgi:hypothetical protein
MAVTNEFDHAVPFLSGGKVVKWELGMTFSNGTSADSNFYQQLYSDIIPSSAITGLSSDFNPKLENSWTRAQLLTLISPLTSHWNSIFLSAVKSVITDPVEKPTSDETYVIPS